MIKNKKNSVSYGLTLFFLIADNCNCLQFFFSPLAEQLFSLADDLQHIDQILKIFKLNIAFKDIVFQIHG